MHALIRRYYRELASGLLFRPLVMTLAHGLLALAAVAIDSALDQPLFAHSADTARAVLTTIAGASFTAVSIAFTVTIVTLQLVSGQFTPRALRGFLGRPWVQLVAGHFVGLVLYCLITLGLMADPGETGYGVPTATAVVLAIIALLVLLVFIDRIAHGIQVSNIIADLVAGTRDALERHYADDPRATDRRPPPDDAWPAIEVETSGVVQSVDLDALLRLSAEAGVAIRLAVQPGDFAVAGQTLAHLEGGALDALDDSTLDAIRGAIVRQSQRDLHMDPAFGVRQLADIAVRALSPGVNDPSTADHCLHWLSALFGPVVAEPRRAARRLAADGGVVEMPLRTTRWLLRIALEELSHKLWSSPVPGRAASSRNEAAGILEVFRG